jgi:uncharacterized membrane protein
MSALIGMLIDMHLYFPDIQDEITTAGLVVGMVLFILGIVVHRKEARDK